MIKQSALRFVDINFKRLIKFKKKSKIYIYPNLNGIGLATFIFFCFLISVFYENNSGLLLSIVIFFIFFISILISHQNINYLKLNYNNVFYVEADQKEKLGFTILNLSKEKKLNINITYNNSNVGNFNFLKRISLFNLNYINNSRGVYELDNISLNSIYPFGVINTKVSFKPNCEIIVYPKSLRPNQDLLNEFNIKKDIKADEFDGIDDFKNGDSLSKVAWKKSTLEKKYIKTFKDNQKSQKLILDLDKYNNIKFERLLSYSTYLIKYFYQKKISLTFKHKENIFLLNNNEKSLNQIFRYLANVKI